MSFNSNLSAAFWKHSLQDPETGLWKKNKSSRCSQLLSFSCTAICNSLCKWIRLTLVPRWTAAEHSTVVLVSSSLQLFESDKKIDRVFEKVFLLWFLALDWRRSEAVPCRNCHEENVHPEVTHSLLFSVRDYLFHSKSLFTRYTFRKIIWSKAYRLCLLTIVPSLF